MLADLPNSGGIAIDPLRWLQGHAPAEDFRASVGCVRVLERHYPGWRWAVDHNSHQGVLVIKNLHLHDRWGMALKLAGTDSPAQWDHAVMMAGGELLERFGCPAGPFTWRAWLGRRSPAAVVVEHTRRATNLGGMGLPILRQRLEAKAAAAEPAAPPTGQEALHGGYRDREQ